MKGLFIILGLALIITIAFLTPTFYKNEDQQTPPPAFIAFLHETASNQAPLNKQQADQIAAGCRYASRNINKDGIESSKINHFHSLRTLESMEVIATRCRQCLGRYGDPRISLASLLMVIAPKITQHPEPYARLIKTQVLLLKSLLDDEQLLKKELAEKEFEGGLKSYPFTSSLIYVGEVLPQAEKDTRFIRAGLSICLRDQERVFEVLWLSTLSSDIPDDDSRIKYIVSLGLDDELAQAYYQKLSAAVRGISK